MKSLLARLGVTDLGPAGLAPVLILFGLNAVDELDQAAFNVLAPEIRDSFGLSNSGIVALRVSLVPVLLAGGLLLGFLADRMGRLRLASIGALAWAVFSVALGLSPNVVAILLLVRLGAGFGRQVNQPTHQSLIADYYPPANRAGAYSIWRLGNPFGQFFGPIVAGVVAELSGSWRWPFLLAALPTIALVAMARRLREPSRGIHERLARGADAELAELEEEAPSWEESWRTLNGVATLRMVWRSLPFLTGGLLGIGILMPLFYEQVFNASETTRGVLAAANEPFSVAGLLVGIPITTRLVRTKPQRVLQMFAAAATLGSLGFALTAIAPHVVVAGAGACMAAFFLAVLTPGFATVSSLIVPPRARGFAFSINDVWSLPGLVFVLVAARIGDANGFRWAITAMIPVFLIGAYIVAGAGRRVAADIKAAQVAALAQAEARRARESGEGKLLVCRGIDVRYGQVQVLFGVDFDVTEGEIVALLGTNGAGKSTLLKAIAGLVDPSAGAIVFDGRDLTHSSPQFALGRGMALMPGGRAVFPTLTVEENLAAASWTRREEADRHIEEIYARFPQLRERRWQPAGNLSGGEQQMLGLGMAFLARPKLLMIDELSLGLAPVIVEQLLDTVRDIHARGTTVVIVEQSVTVALSLAQRAVFMEKGEVRFEGATAELLGRDDILRSVFLGGASAAFETAPRRRRRRRSSATPVLTTTNVAKSFGGIHAVQDVSLEVAPGDVVGLIGANGAGKTTLFDLISGFVETDHGSIALAGADVTAWSASRRARARLGRSFQDAALFPSMTVRETIATAHDRLLQSRDAFSAALAFPDQRVEESILAARVDELIDLLGLGAFASKFVGELSTGSRRIVDIACALAHDPVVLLLDEPSSGIAQRETEALGPLLLSIRDATGCALLVIEHDMPLITGIADRLYALELGQVIAEGAPGDVVNDERVIASYLGGDASAINRSGPLVATSQGVRE